MNNKAQMGGMNFLMGILIVSMSIIVFVSLVPSISESIGTMRNSEGLNCASYVDPAGLHSYNATLDTNTLACTVGNLMIPFLVLGVLIGAIFLIVYSKSESQYGQPQY